MMSEEAHWDYQFDPEKNAWLICERGISFEQIIALIHGGKLIQVWEHPDKARYPSQLLYEIDVDGYVYVVPVAKEGQNAIPKRPSIPAERRRGNTRNEGPNENSGISR